ncbi:MAG: hypothetical protein WC389_17230 [Lutibacter sp.]|jgi:negative regulator of sigma E activity
MLDEKDIKKLVKAQKEIFATKEDIENLIDIVGTKDELENFRTELKADIMSVKKDINKDINKVVEILYKMDGKLDEVVQNSKDVEYIKNILNITATKR